MESFEQLTIRAEKLLGRLENLLASTPTISPDWSAIAYRWQRGALLPVRHLQAITLEGLHDIAQQKQRIEQNTRQFVQGRSANNVLLTGARGTGKSSLVKALLNQFAAQGLRLIEIDKAGLNDLPDIIELVGDRAERFILYCDDLSFNDDEPGYQALKAALDGSIVALPENLIIYATSNRRHLMPEYMQENLATKHIGDEVHPAEGVEEKISLSERFGLWISFYPFTQDEYLAIAQHWLAQLGGLPFTEEARRAALQWALMRGSRSGRVANQFAKDWCGQHENS
jgi:predicted AAA+ superfamily ATPase